MLIVNVVISYRELQNQIIIDQSCFGLEINNLIHITFTIQKLGNDNFVNQYNLYILNQVPASVA